MQFQQRPRVHIAAAISVFVISIVWILFASPVLANSFGVYSSLIGELFFLFISLLAVIISRVPLGNVLKTERIRFRHIAGVFVLYIGANYLVSGITVIMQILFPLEMAELSIRMAEQISNMQLWQGLLIVGVSAAVCEEIMCRGVLLNSLSGIKSKGLIIAIMGILFGILHLDPFRFFITGILGAVLTYIMLETQNIFMPILYHFVNNTVSVIASNSIDASSLGDIFAGVDIAAKMSNFVMLVYAAAAPFIIFLGVLLIRRDRERSPEKRKKNKRLLIASAVIAAVFVSAGIAYMVFG